MRIIFGNQYLKAQLDDTRKFLNANCSLRLFANDFFPFAGTLLGQFAEPTYAGYARQALVGVFPLPIKVFDGLYESRCTQRTFTSTTTIHQTVYGWFIADATMVYVSFRFDNPKVIHLGVPVRFIIALQDGDNSLLCP